VCYFCRCCCSIFGRGCELWGGVLLLQR
jgi:hypothetical protein